MSLSGCFSKVANNGLLRRSLRNNFVNITAGYSRLWEPDYLIKAKTKTPEYDTINFQIKGFDYVILQSFQSFIHKLARLLDVDVANGWATPQQDLKIHTFLPKSSTVDHEYLLKVYERNIQVVDVKSHVMPLLIEAVVTSCPPGVQLSVHEHENEMEEIRYVPLYDVIEKEKELKNIGTGKHKKK